MGVALSSTEDSNVKLAQVKVEVHSLSGARLMDTDCAPNGYFFIPLSRPGVTSKLMEEGIRQMCHVSRKVHR